MSTYEEEHNIEERPRTSQSEDTTSRGRLHASLGSIMDTFLRNNTSDSPSNVHIMEAFTSALNQLHEFGSILSEMLSELDSNEVGPNKGVSDEFLDTLERVRVTSIKDEDAFCPICTNKFKDDKYPLVVRLPCGHGVNHIYDLECVGPWLQMNATCPLCRTNVLEVAKTRREKIQEEIRKAREEDSEDSEEDWDVYG